MSASASRSAAFRSGSAQHVAARQQQRFERPDRPDTAPRASQCSFGPRCSRVLRSVPARRSRAAAAAVLRPGSRAARVFCGRARSAGSCPPRSGRADADSSSPSPRPCSRTPAPSGTLRRSSSICSAQTSTTRAMSARAISGRVRSWRGEKQITRQVPAPARPAAADRATRRWPACRAAGAAKVVGEDKRSRVSRIELAVPACCRGRGSTWDHKPGAVVRWRSPVPLPRALRPVRRHQHPLAGQRIEPAMRMVFGVKCHTATLRGVRMAWQPPSGWLPSPAVGKDPRNCSGALIRGLPPE